MATALRSRLRRSGPGYGDAVRILWETSRPLAGLVAVYTIAASILPNLVFIFAGRLVGDVPAAARTGLGSAAGDRLFTMLGLAGLA